ncbi:MAG: hypothetical protein NC092_11385, partial [Butyrivibrio sp.]|nr:hypothetical protein [Muribaculum sp.]MCM1553284.1 hypothetical protein [Butyrivibrio sp.]
DGQWEVTLQKVQDGYLFVSNVRAEDDTNNSSSMEKYVYKYFDEQERERHLSIDYYDEFTYSTEEYIGSTFESDGTPDWGIRVSFSGETDSDYLYFYRCRGKGYEIYKEYPDEDKELVQAGDYKLVLIYLEDKIVGYSSMGTEWGQGILLEISNERWEDLSDAIIALVASAEFD